MSARSSSAGSSSKLIVAPPKRLASACARSRRRLATNSVATPRSCSASRGQLGRLAGADDQHVAVGEVAVGVQREVDGDRGDAVAALADRRLGAHALARLERRAEELVGQRAGRARVERELVGALDLALDLGLADDHRVQPADDAVQVARGVAVAQRVDALEQLGRAQPGAAREHADDRRSRPRPGRRRRGRAPCGCRSRATTASWTSGCSRSSASRRSDAGVGQRDALAQRRARRSCRTCRGRAARSRVHRLASRLLASAPASSSIVASRCAPAATAMIAT